MDIEQCTVYITTICATLGRWVAGLGAGTRRTVMLQEILNRWGALQLICEVLAVLEVKDSTRIELDFNQDGISTFRGVEDGVHVQIEGAFALANLILQPRDLEVPGCHEPLVRAHHVLRRLADVRCPQDVCHELGVRRMSSPLLAGIFPDLKVVPSKWYLSASIFSSTPLHDKPR